MNVKALCGLLGDYSNQSTASRGSAGWARPDLFVREDILATPESRERGDEQRVTDA